MTTISLCMIVKNEEHTLARCLSSVQEVVDEIIIVDTGSTDNTKEVAAGFTDKIYDFEWVDDFSAARNFSFAQASMEYILWLDADDLLLPEDAAKLKALKDTLPPDVDAVMMRYNTGFDAQGRVTFSFFRERLSKRSGGFLWREPVHEYLEVVGKRINTEICVTHAKPPGRAVARNIRIYEQVINSGQQLTPRGMYYYARELTDNKNYAEAITWFRRFLADGKGWAEDNITACGELGQCLLAEHKPAEAVAAMTQSFYYDTPRAEICCQIGYYFKEQHKYKQAAFWFKTALGLERNNQGWGFCKEECWGYIPCIELAVCCDKLGDYAKAAAFNEQAATYKPNSPAVEYNRKYFAEKIKNNGQ